MTCTKCLSVVVVVLISGFGGASGQTLTTLWQFGDNATSGLYPSAGLVQGTDGNFYGTTSAGGTNNEGTVFNITSQGTLTTLHQFGSSPNDGSSPYAGLVQSTDGNFYGTTVNGGTNNEGTVFNITPQGTLTTLYQFGSSPNDGTQPTSSLMQSTDGNFYGTTRWGGACATCGTVFKITPQGTLTTLWQFNILDQQPYAGLVQGSDSNFYGSTEADVDNIFGTVFKITPQGTLTTLWQFSGGNGEGPFASMVQGGDGSFYGTDMGGGKHEEGTVFKITPQGTLTNLWQFGGNPTNGIYPKAGLVQGSDGNFYGTTVYGGTNNEGTVFNITSQGTLTTLHQFRSSPSDGTQPTACLVQGTDGNFYGTTSTGGTNNEGTVFRISVPLTPPANQISSAQVDSSGTNLVFSIPSVAYETYQLQFSASMNPTNWSNVLGAVTSNSLGATLTLTNFGGAVGPQGFYRFAITP
jgi:uncharacterized repeat protein (TIGR03803 family)